MDELTQKGHEVHNIPFITTRPITVLTLPDADWIFFSSKKGVKHFFNQQLKIPSAVKFGCLGYGTAEELGKYVKHIDFIGKQPNTDQVGMGFAKLAESQTVLFPIAKRSNRTIQKQFVDQQKVKDCIVYETILIPHDALPAYDVIVFSSPSNVESFSSKHSFSKDKRHIAIGTSTLNRLLNFGVNNAEISFGFSDKDLVNAVLKNSI